MALQIGNAACVLEIVSDRDASEGIYYIYFTFLKNLYIVAALKISTGIVAVMSSLLVVLFFFPLLVYWDSGWYGFLYYICQPRVCVFSSLHGTRLKPKIHDI